MLHKKKEKLFFRNEIQKEIRIFFEKKGVVEVNTPILQESPGMELHLKAFSTTWENPSTKKKKNFYLHSSPEFAMKRLLSMGSGDIFQFARSFRNELFSPTHHPEFTLLEWYRLSMSYEDLMEEAIDCIRACAKISPSQSLSWMGRRSNPFQEWEKISVVEAFRKYAGIDLRSSLEDGQNPSRTLLAMEAKNIGIDCEETDSWEDIFFRIFLNKVEKNLGHGVPCILYQYPACMAALSKIDEKDSRFARRFEIYISGLELANAFEELQDPKEQRMRFLKTMQQKETLYKFSYPMDKHLLEALELGLPACSGIALGFDRLMMLLTGSNTIEEVLWMPVEQDMG